MVWKSSPRAQGRTSGGCEKIFFFLLLSFLKNIHINLLSYLFVGNSEVIHSFPGIHGFEAPILRPPYAKSWFIGKDPDAGKDWRQEEKGAVENEIVDGITDWTDVRLSTLWEIVKDREAWCAVVHRVTKSHTGLSDWATWIDRKISKFILFKYIEHSWQNKVLRPRTGLNI